MSYFSHLIRFINGLSMCRIMSILISRLHSNYFESTTRIITLTTVTLSLTLTIILLNSFRHFLPLYRLINSHPIPNAYFRLKLSFSFQAACHWDVFLLEDNRTNTSMCVVEWMNDCKKRSRHFSSIIHMFYSRISIDWFIDERMNELLYFINGIQSNFHVYFWRIDLFFVSDKSLHFIVVHSHSHVLIAN